MDELEDAGMTIATAASSSIGVWTEAAVELNR